MFVVSFKKKCLDTCIQQHPVWGHLMLIHVF